MEEKHRACISEEMAQPPSKRLKAANQEPQIDALWKMRCLLPEAFSPGSPYSNRLAIQVQDNASCQVFIATGNSIFQGHASCHENMPHAQGYGKVQLPATLQEDFKGGPTGISLPGEIQSLALAQSNVPCLCAVDCFGQAVLQPLDDSGTCQGNSVLLGDPNDALEPGWAGICAWTEGGKMHSAVAHHLGSCLKISQNEKLLRHVGTLNHPNAITNVTGSQGTMLALAEGHQVTMWDIRASERRGCFSRMTPGGSDLPLYAVAADSSGTLIAAGGAESTAFFFDVRKGGQPLDRWPGCLKHDILAIHFPATRSDFVFVAGVDQNVRCSLVDSRARKAAISPGKTSQQGTRGQKGEGGVSFRGDGRWLGLARDPRRDLLACLTASSSLIFADFSFPDCA